MFARRLSVNGRKSWNFASKTEGQAGPRISTMNRVATQIVWLSVLSEHPFLVYPNRSSAKRADQTVSQSSLLYVHWVRDHFSHSSVLSERESLSYLHLNSFLGLSVFVWRGGLLFAFLRLWVPKWQNFSWLTHLQGGGRGPRDCQRQGCF